MADAVRPYRTLGYPVVPAFFVLAAAAAIAASFYESVRMSLLGTGILLVGVLVYAITRRRS
jgi:APA family basic amino acid/polyamine antiporter